MKRIRFDRKDVVPVLVLATVLAFVIFGVWLWLSANANASVSQPAPPFDHSDCQYPERLSNPPDGCDNSDPARPECMKFGTEDCDLPYADGSLPIRNETVAPAASHEVKPSEKPLNCTEITK